LSFDGAREQGLLPPTRRFDNQTKSREQLRKRFSLNKSFNPFGHDRITKRRVSAFLSNEKL
jgi:hypothetical protein